TFGFAAYRGKTTRVMLSLGPSFAYSVGAASSISPSAQPRSDSNRFKSVAFAFLGGLALEQFFTPKISILVGMKSPLFQFTSTEFDGGDADKKFGASFDATRLGAAVVFYTD